MGPLFIPALFLVLSSHPDSPGSNPFERDVVKTSGGDLTITFIGHGTLMMEYKGTVIHVDPVPRYADYDKLPKAGMVLVTHHHGDHFDVPTINKIRTEKTVVIIPKVCDPSITGGTVMNNGDVRTFGDITVESVPAYNLIHKRDDGSPFHPKGEGNGYVLTIGGTRIYIAGDTENTPEMKAQKKIDIAFLPMNLPYTMTPEMVADAAKGFRPKVLYPYHYGDTDPQKLVGLLKNEKGIEVRVRKMR
jgi:L-ascorbate metabolism protein UlaG (beta-lactamase superfamily)